MSQGNDFANYSAASNAGTGGSDEVWFVAVASDDIKQMTIDQLDEAFRLGIITGETPVWTEGMEAWAPLAKVADLDGDSGSEARDANHAPGNTGTYGTASNGGSYGAAANGGGYGAAPNTGSYGAAANGGGYGAASNMGGYGAASNAGAYGAAGAGFGAVTLQSVQHSFAPGPSSVAPVTASYAPGPHAGQSPLPVAINGDEEVAPVPRGRGFRPARWLLAGAAAIAIGVVAYNNLSSSVASAGTEAAAPAALAARPYDSAEGAGSTSAGSARSNTSARGDGEAAAPSRGTDEAIGAAVVASAAAAASTTAKAALHAEEDEPSAPASKKGAEKDSLKSSFSKSLTKKGTSSRSAKVKPRRAASRASTKSRAPKAKKSTVVRTQSAFDPLNDSLP